MFFEGIKNMYCQNCGAENQTKSNFCVVCGVPLNTNSIVDNETDKTTLLSDEETALLQEDSVMSNNQQPNYADTSVQTTYNQFACNVNNYNQIVSKEEFFTKLLSKNSKSWIKALWIICFITVVLCAITIITGNIFAVVDVVFYLVFGILLKKKQDWKIALAITCYSALGTLITMITAGMASGLFPLICGVMATKTLKKADKTYEQYKTTGVYPTEQI